MTTSVTAAASTPIVASASVAERSEAPAAALGVADVEAGVDHPRPVRPDDRPHEVVHRHRDVVRVAAEEVLGRARASRSAYLTAYTR